MRTGQLCLYSRLPFTLETCGLEHRSWMLLTHVILICTSADYELQGDSDTRKQGEETVMSLCKKIWLHQGINSGDKHFTFNVLLCSVCIAMRAS
ncbi:hypothetical protein RLOC_00009490 [Lonchura striata]|uniref:Uncharacterized protein n=1 Tax=Lonchura striata TaxID=40157 RepID=A0A218U9R5_9PASE|nr:hypothetical protein RLOC_00009490 [Lonchura striata domestica]